MEKAKKTTKLYKVALARKVNTVISLICSFVKLFSVNKPFITVTSYKILKKYLVIRD